MNFKEWLTSDEGMAQSPAAPVQTPSVPTPPITIPEVKPEFVVEPWKASKKQVIQYWKSLPQNMPLNIMKSIPFKHKGKTMNYDGIRVTGSPGFINYVMSKIKDLTNYENEKTRLELVYRQQINKKMNAPVPDAYMFYAQCKQRPAHR